MGLFSKLFGSSTSDVDFNELLTNGAKLIDVRTPGEFQSGHASKAVNIPLDTIQNNIDKIKAYNNTIVLVCRSGQRASMANKILTKAGIESYNAGAWQNVK